MAWMTLWEELSGARCQTPVEVIVVTSRNIHGMCVSARLLPEDRLTYMDRINFPSCSEKLQIQNSGTISIKGLCVYHPVVEAGRARENES